MTCAHCGKPWEPTGHWCAIQPDTLPDPRDAEIAALRGKLGQLERVIASDRAYWSRLAGQVADLSKNQEPT